MTFIKIIPFYNSFHKQSNRRRIKAKAAWQSQQKKNSNTLNDILYCVFPR